MTYRDDDTAAKSYSPCAAQSRLLAINVKKYEACLRALAKHCSQTAWLSTCITIPWLQCCTVHFQ